MLDGKTAIITGAAHGLGRATAILYREANARVIAVDLDGEGLAGLAADDSDMTTITADVTSAADADRIIAAGGPDLNVLVNCAGVLDRLALADETDDDQFRRVIEINLTGPFLLSKRAIPVMRASGGGVIINVASIAGVRGGRAGAAYTASKHGLVGLTLNMAATLGNDVIRAVAVCPGGMVTGMDRGGEVSERGSQVISGRDLHRPPPGTADEVASVLTFLASDGASRMNGSVVVVDGGATAY